MAITRPPLLPGESFTMSPSGRALGLTLSGTVAALSISLAVLAESPLLLLGIVPSFVSCLLIYVRSLTDLLIIGEGAAIARRGLFRANTHILPLADLRVHIRQGVIARALNMGTVVLQEGERRVEVSYLGDIDHLVTVLATRIGTSRVLLQYQGRKP